MNGYGMNTTPPVSEGEELNVTIMALGDKGDGIAKKDGFVIVVPGTQVNDNVRIKITKVLRRVAFAEVVGQSEGASEEEEQPAEEEATEEEPSAEEDASEEPEKEEEPAPEGEDSENFGEDLEN